MCACRSREVLAGAPFRQCRDAGSRRPRAQDERPISLEIPSVHCHPASSTGGTVCAHLASRTAANAVTMSARVPTSCVVRQYAGCATSSGLLNAGVMRAALRCLPRSAPVLQSSNLSSTMLHSGLSQPRGGDGVETPVKGKRIMPVQDANEPGPRTLCEGRGRRAWGASRGETSPERARRTRRDGSGQHLATLWLLPRCACHTGRGAL